MNYLLVIFQNQAILYRQKLDPCLPYLFDMVDVIVFSLVFRFKWNKNSYTIFVYFFL